MTKRRPIASPEKRVRQRQRADGSWRIWWEAEAAVVALGFSSVELDPARLTWSQRTARKLNDDVAKKREGSTPSSGKVGGRTMSALINSYRASRHFTALRPATKLGYKTNLNFINAHWGAEHVGIFTAPVCSAWYDTLLEVHGVSYAKSLMLTMSRLFWYAEREGWRAENTNPARNLDLRAAPPRARYATWAEFETLMAAADEFHWPQMAVACGLSALNGSRQTDILAARIADFEMQELTDVFGKNHGQRLIWKFTRSKRDNLAVLPTHEMLEPRILELIDAAPPDQSELLTNPGTTNRLTQRQFSKLWRDLRNRAEKTMPSISTLQFRDLRRSFGVWARQGGSDKADIGDVLGNSAAVNPLLGETYMPETVFSAARAIDSIRKPK